MNDNKPFMDIESDFEPALVFIVRKYHLEELKWQINNGGREILEKYPDLEKPQIDVIEHWQNLETSINPLAESTREFEEMLLQQLGEIALQQTNISSKTEERSQAYFKFIEARKNILKAYRACKDAVVHHYSLLAQAALDLAGESSIYQELEKKEFRNLAYKSVYSSLDDALAAEQEIWNKSQNANEAYMEYMILIKTDPILSEELEVEETEPLGRRKSFFMEQRKFVETIIRKLYDE